jgi:hypothetical protein
MQLNKAGRFTFSAAHARARREISRRANILGGALTKRTWKLRYLIGTWMLSRYAFSAASRKGGSGDGGGGGGGDGGAQFSWQ